MQAQLSSAIFHEVVIIKCWQFATVEDAGQKSLCPNKFAIKKIRNLVSSAQLGAEIITCIFLEQNSELSITTVVKAFLI